MDLLLGQLVYTSLAGVGFRTLKSAQVSEEIQQAFSDRLVSRYWNSYNPPPPGYRAAYIYQLSPDKTLFGWLYNDELDDIGRSDVPYFICYYQAETLHDFHLKSIFTCLQMGPIALVNRHEHTATLEKKVLPNLWNYEPARPGVAIPRDVRVRSDLALKQGELLDLFVPVAQQQMVIELDEQTYEQQIADLSTYNHYIIEGIKSIATGIGSLNGYDSNEAGESIKSYLLTDGQPVHKLAEATTQDASPPKTLTISKQTHASPLVTFKLPQFLSSSHVSSQHSEEADPATAYKSSQFLLKVAIFATVLALIGSIYGLLVTVFFAPNNSELVSARDRLLFQKTFADVPNVPQGLFYYGGSTTFAPLRFTALVSSINKAYPKFQLRYAGVTGSASGSDTGIRMLLAGELSFVQSSRPLKATELAQAKERGFALEQVPVAIDGIAFYVNRQVSVNSLNLSQLKRIFTGKITNWKALGGPNLPITPFSRNPQTSGTVEFVQERVLAGEPFGATVWVNNTTDSIRRVANTPGGIGFASMSQVLGQKSIHPLSLSKSAGQTFISPGSGAIQKQQNLLLKINKDALADGSYPLTRQLFIVIKRDGKRDEQAGVAYVNFLLTQEGQQILEQAGFVPIR